jgi:hypothetical protein
MHGIVMLCQMRAFNIHINQRILDIASVADAAIQPFAEQTPPDELVLEHWNRFCSQLLDVLEAQPSIRLFGVSPLLLAPAWCNTCAS